jgi:Fur family ferric uptake transcriptional regulator
MKPIENSRLHEWLFNLKSSGYRLTDSRKVLVEIIASSNQALSANELYDLGREMNKSLGLVTVYRTLEKLEELGLIQRVHRENNCHSYLRASQGHEHLILCSNCGRAAFFSGDDLSKLFKSVSDRTKYKIEDHWLQLIGICESCQKLENSNSS